MFKPKTAKTEYEPSMLPHNRKEVFFDVVKLNWGRLLLCGCLVLLLSLPLHVSAILDDLYQTQLSALVNAGELTARTAAELASSSSNTTALLDIPLLALFAVGASGLAHIMRQYAWEENVYFRHEYIKGVRQNAGSFAKLGLLVALIRFFCRWFQNLFFLNGGTLYYIGYIPAVWFALVFFAPCAYMTVCIPIYDVSFCKNMQTAFLLYLKNILKSLLAVAGCVLPFLIQLVPSFGVRLFGRLIFSLAVPYITLGWFLFGYDRLDAAVNRKQYPELVGRGTVSWMRKEADGIEP